MFVQKVIEQLGYSPSEAKIYLTTLELGEARITQIASKANMPRTTAEMIAMKLRERGLMDFYVQRRYKYWTAEDPEQLLKKIQKRGAAMIEALPTLTRIQQKGRSARRGKGNSLKHALFLRILANASPQPMLITNEDLEIEHVNTAWEEQFGYRLAEVKGEHPRMLQSGKTPPVIYERMWKALRAGKSFQTDEIIDKKADGSFFTLLTTIFLIDYAGHRYYIQILSDITKEKEAEGLKKSILRLHSKH